MRIGMVVPKFNNEIVKRYTMPVGLAYVKAALKKAGYDVYGINLCHRWGNVKKQLEDWLEENEINVLMTCGLTADYKLIREIFDVATKQNRDIVKVGGGGGFSSEPILFTEMTGADYSVIGEGEETICEFIRVLEDRGDMSKVAGLVWRNNDGEYVQNKMRPVINDLDQIPFPDYEDFDMDEYLTSQNTYDTYEYYMLDEPRALPMVMGRSCPFRCNFCYHPSGDKYRQRTLDNFFEELDFMLGRYKVNHLSIMDELFATDRTRMLDFCKRIKPYKIDWSIQLRVNLVDKELLKILRNAGCTSISYGIESFSPTVLKNMNKKITTLEIEKTLKMTYEAGITIQGNFIFGDETETMETFSETLHWWRNHREYQLNLSFIETYPGTQLYKNCVKRGVIKDRRRFIESGCPVINMTQLSDDEFEKMRAIVAIEIHRDGCEKGKVISIEKTNDNFSQLRLECPNCGGVNTYNRIENMRVFSNRFKIPCRKCGKKSIYDTRGFMSIRDSEMKHMVYFNMLKQYVKNGNKIDWSRLDGSLIAVYYEEEMGMLFIDDLIFSKKIQYIIDEKKNSRYEPIWEGLTALPSEIAVAQKNMPADILLIMETLESNKIETIARDYGFKGQVITLFDVLMGI